jgi:hypothetical protein
MTYVPIDVRYLEYALILVVFVGVQKVLGPQRLRRLLTSHRAYNYVSYGGLASVTILLFGGVNYAGNPLMIRMSAQNSGHLFTWIAIMLVAWRFGHDDFVNAVLTAGLFAALHEIFGVSATLIAGTYGDTTLLNAAEYYSAFFVLLAAIIIARVTYSGTKDIRPTVWATAAVIAVYTALWASIGYPAALNLLGPTAYFDNPDVNLLESLSWMIPAIVMVMPRRGENA